MRIDFAAFWLHKDGGSARDYEDAFAPAAADGTPRGVLRCAVADGAGESAYAKVWARQLVGGYAAGRLTGPHMPELPVLAGRWSRAVARSRERLGDAAWYLDRKIDDGAFAAFVGLELRSDPNAACGDYTMTALGDSCCLHVRADAIVAAFPLAAAAAFSARPLLVPSRPAAADGFAGAIVEQRGTWAAGDAFYLMTDALACWFIAAAERGLRPWRELDAFERRDRAAFRRWVAALRGSSLKNDDVTLLRLRVHRA